MKYRTGLTGQNWSRSVFLFKEVVIAAGSAATGEIGNVLEYKNDCMDGTSGNYRTSQNYSYDGLYQLVGAHGESSYTPDHLLVVESTYTQDFAFDPHGFGNMMSKTAVKKPLHGRN